MKRISKANWYVFHVIMNFILLGLVVYQSVYGGE